ncbi:hypothetical protein ACFL2V_01025 [Pseudomonadota bacterium]
MGNEVKKIRSGELVSYLKYHLQHPPLTDKEVSNLCGDYILIRRNTYKESDDKRPLYITTLKIFTDSEEGIKFQYVKQNLSAKRSLVSGIVIRETSNALRLIGFLKDKSGNNVSLKVIGLSITVEELEEGQKKYINGGIFGVEDSDSKPYHTWLHMAKINNMDKFSRNVSGNGIWNGRAYSYHEPTTNFHTITLPISIGRFNLKDKHTKEIISLISGGYPTHREKESIIRYISEHMYLDEKKAIPHHAL